jgi:hypothetical protein
MPKAVLLVLALVLLLLYLQPIVPDLVYIPIDKPSNCS